MSAFDPSDVNAVRAALDGALAPRARVTGDPTAVTAATSTWVWFVDLEPAPTTGQLVLRIFRPGEEHVAERDEALSEVLLRHGLPVAAARWRGTLGEAHPAVLQDRLPGRPAIEAMAGPAIRRVLTGLAALQARLHRVPPDAVPLARVTASSYLADDLGRRRAGITATDPTGGWEWLQRTAAAHDDPAAADVVVCHGDFHPLNALVAADGTIGLVDWTDACIADRHHDVARTTALYWFASLVASSRAERYALRALRGWMVRTHLRGYQAAAATTLDPRRLAWWQVAHLYRGWLQLGELAEGAVHGPESTTTERFPEHLRDRLLERCVRLRAVADPARAW